jgi:hypothetical protein
MKRAALVLLLLAGCKPDTYEGHGVHWKPPRGVSFSADAAGPPPAAQFSGGVTLTFHPKEGLPAEDHLEEIATKFIPQGVMVMSKRAGSINAGKVARYVWKEGGNRVLMYYLPGKDQVLVITMTAPEARFSADETHFDLSLASLRFQ